MDTKKTITNYAEADDTVLVDLSRNGDTQAYDTLVRRHSRRLHSMLCQMTGNESDAYDIAQDAFIKAYHSLRYFSGRSAFYTWLYSIAANEGRSFLRKKKRENSYSINNDEHGDALEKDARLADNSITADPERLAHIKDLKAKLIRALDTLSFKHREVVNLYDIQGLSYGEIAKLLNISEGTLRSRLHYAHKQLQGLLSDEINNLS